MTTTPESGIFVYVSQSGSRQISVLRLAPDTGALTPVQDMPVNGKVMPMAVSPDRRFLYAALRSKPWAVANFAIDAQSGRLTHLGDTPVADSMVNICTDRTGRYLLGATNPPGDGGEVDRNDWRRTGLVSVSAIGEHGCVQSPYELFRTPPKLHAVMPDPSNRFVFGTSCDGDVIVRYAFDAAMGILNPDPLPPVMVLRRAGPRHFKFHPNNRFLYLLNEYDGSVYAFRYDVRNGSLSEIQISSAVPPDFDIKARHARTADLHFTPDGRWLYASMRNSTTLAAFAVDASTGLLTPAGHFTTANEPRSFAIDPYGRYLFATGMHEKNLATFRIDSTTGALTRLADVAMGDGPNWIECVRLS